MLYRLLRNDEGANLIEWGILVVLIAIVAIIALQFVGAENSQMWSEIDSGLSG